MLTLLLLPMDARAGVFLSPEQASAMLQEGAVALDARGGEAWASGHLPRSAPLAWTSLRDGLLRDGRLTDDGGRLREALAAAGVGSRTAVIVYDAGREGWGEAGRIWWTLDYLGHDQVYLLDGGLPAWSGAGLPTEAGTTSPPRGDFQPRPRPERRATLEEVEDAVRTCSAGPCSTLFWDTREGREFAGATPYGEPRGGHLPGAVHLWYADLTDGTGRLLPDERLKARMRAAGLPAPEAGTEIVTYCTGGVRSGFALAVLRELGYTRAANYDGSMWEWSASDERPLNDP